MTIDLRDYGGFSFEGSRYKAYRKSENSLGLIATGTIDENEISEAIETEDPEDIVIHIKTGDWEIIDEEDKEQCSCGFEHNENNGG